MSELNIFTLDNGIRVVHRQVSSTKILHCGIVLDIGSRDELPEQYGIAHFWEHMAFKGTSKRKAYHIINSLDSVGGELNAYTTKEKIWAKSLSEMITPGWYFLTLWRAAHNCSKFMLLPR